jgi:hypothetical protein
MQIDGVRRGQADRLHRGRDRRPFLEEPDEIATYRRIFTAFANCALDERESRDLIADLAVRLYAD